MLVPLPFKKNKGTVFRPAFPCGAAVFQRPLPRATRVAAAVAGLIADDVRCPQALRLANNPGII